MLTSFRFLRGVALISALCTTRVALAEQATVLLRDGTRVTGELREYVPDDHVTLNLEASGLQTFPVADVDALKIGVELDTHATALSVPPPVTATTEDPRIHALRLRRYDVRKNRVSIALPVVLISVGAAAGALGWGALLPISRDTCYWDSEYATHAECKWTGGAIAGAAIGSAGMAAFVTGIALLPGRIARRRARKRELDAIDGELRNLTARLSVAPWLQGGSQRVAGIRAHLSF